MVRDLFDLSSALFARSLLYRKRFRRGFLFRAYPISPTVGFHCIDRNAQKPSYFRTAFPLLPVPREKGFILFCHLLLLPSDHKKNTPECEPRSVSVVVLSVDQLAVLAADPGVLAVVLDHRPAAIGDLAAIGKLSPLRATPMILPVVLGAVLI